MSIELSRNLAGDPEHRDFEHRIDHDIESLLLVFLHIVRFTCGPKGDPEKEIYVNEKELSITQWHHEPLIEQIAHHKSIDLLRLRGSIQFVSQVLPDYWKSIAPNLINLINIVYPSPTIPLKTGHNIRDAFKKELEVILEVCRSLEEDTHDFGTSMPFQTRAKKRKALTQGSRSIQPRTSKGTHTKRKKLAKNH